MENITITIEISDNNEISRKEALKIARVFNLEKEVIWCIDYCGYTPVEALKEWDLIQKVI